MRTNRLLKNLVILGLVLLTTSGVYAQLITSSLIREDVEIWTPLVNPTQSQSGNDFVIAIPMLFPFQYDNQNVSNVYAFENGFLSINATRDPSGSSLPGFPNTTNIISWYNRDLFTTGSLSYKYEGTAPFRVLTIQQTGARLLNDFSGRSFDAQVKLYETTNEVKIIYNNVTGFGFSELAGGLYFIGGGTTRYLNVQPRVPTLPSIVYNGSINPNAQRHLTEDVRKYFSRGRSFTLTSTPRIAGINPPNNAVLSTNQIYSGDNRPYVRVSRDVNNKEVVVRYSITGPIGGSANQVIYTAINAADIAASESVEPNPQPVGTGIRVLMPHAKGPAGRLSDGALDLTAQAFESGEYQVDAYLEYKDGTPYTHYQSSRFTVAFPSDLAILDVLEPIFNPGSIYQFSGVGVPIKILVKNQGADPLDYIYAVAKIRNASGQIEEVTATFELDDDPILFNESRELTFPTLYKPSAIGLYDIQVEVSMRNAFFDKFLANNVFPRDGADKKYFEVAYQIEAETVSMLNPSTVYINRPVRLAARFRNNGVSDISNTVARFRITYSGLEVYNQLIALKDLPSGLVRTSDLYWELPFIPSVMGTYSAEVTVFADNDEVPFNNTKTYSINVIAGMSGTYSISKSGGNFTTITDAVNALYERGVVGPVTFLLKDPIYVEGNPSLNTPTLDFSSSIVGLDNPNNSVTFTIDPQFSTRATVQVSLYSATGIGVYFGQSSYPSNPKAPILDVNASLVKKYANPAKNIIFDGGSKKSLVFTVGTTNEFRSVFYLGNGASNIQVKNILIEDGILQAQNNNCVLPLSSFNSFLNRFEFDQNANAAGTFSAGVTLRSLPPTEPSLGSNPFNLDTLANSHNIISGNEIQKFGYGIVSLGIGQLLNFGKFEYQKYYNHHNKFNNNIIQNVAKAGIFLGYEMDSEVFGNRIYSVSGACGDYTAGIAAGGEARGSKAGYNVIRLNISSNEISNVRGTEYLYGISIEQARNDYYNLETPFSFPDEDENLKIINNIIWGFETFNPAAHINAIMIATERSTGNYDWNGMTFQPKYIDYASRNDVITNNTILLSNDGALNTGAVVGVALFNTVGGQLFNNAIDVNDPQISLSNPITASVFYYGLHPNISGFKADRNAFWLTAQNAAIYRFIETDYMGRVIEFGHKTEFATLNQWQNWTQQDWNSVYDDFFRDYEATGITPFKLRVKQNPAPLGSVLNNRGIKIAGNDVDIDGKLRGEAGERYDIGAVEFRGRTFGRDGEAVAFLTPGAYKSTAPLPFNESEYIMTTAPVAVKAIIRNNGQLPISFQNVSLKIYRQLPGGTFIQEGATISLPMNDIPFSDDIVADFLTADGINNPPNNYEFFPQTYGQLRSSGYVVPDQFKAMEANVTPLYKLEVTLQDDEFNANNKIEKVVRFFIRKSPVQLLISAENIKTSKLEFEDGLDAIAGNLNLDSLKATFFRLGWYINLDLEDPRIDIDILDRRRWEPRSINYPMYRSLLWVDGHDYDAAMNPKRLTRYDRDQLHAYLNAGTFANKKNLLIGSQEIVRNETPHYPDWLTNVLSAKIGNPENPLGPDGNYSGEFVSGVIIGRDNEFEVRSTNFFGDDYPRVAANLINNPGIGLTRIGMKYESHINDGLVSKVPDAQRIAVLTTSAVNYNVIFAGIDWRHWGNLDQTMRAFFDDAQYNNGNIIPIELLSFDAKAVGNRVDLNWVTASEINASKFVIERSNLSETGKNFMPIEEVAAVGNSNITNYYGPIVDSKVSMGNTYIYRLKMLDRNGDFEYSDEKVVALTSVNGAISLNEVMPNPARDMSTVEFSISNDMDVTLSIYDMNGKEVSVIASGRLNIGTHKYDINAAQMTTGAYTVVLRSGDVVLTTKLNVVK